MCYKHNFTPHRAIIWNNENIVKGNKSIFISKWFEKNVIYIQDLFGDDGQILSYGTFINKYLFPIPPRDFNSVIRSILTGIKELFKALDRQVTASITEPILIDGIKMSEKICSNKHGRNSIQKQNRFRPACKAHWSSKFENINWEKTWLYPFKYSISNKIIETHWKIVHNIYSTNLYIARFTDKEDKCVFCNAEVETLSHLFYVLFHA